MGNCGKNQKTEVRIFGGFVKKGNDQGKEGDS